MSGSERGGRPGAAGLRRRGRRALALIHRNNSPTLYRTRTYARSVPVYPEIRRTFLQVVQARRRLLAGLRTEGAREARRRIFRRPVGGADAR